MNKPLLQIELTDINSAPKVFYKGEEVKHIVKVALDYRTDTDKQMNPTFIQLEHWDLQGKFDTKIIQHNQPLIRE
jgi:hypothetical protein